MRVIYKNINLIKLIGVTIYLFFLLYIIFVLENIKDLLLLCWFFFLLTNQYDFQGKCYLSNLFGRKSYFFRLLLRFSFSHFKSINIFVTGSVSGLLLY